MHEYNAAGIDIGTVSIAIVLLDRNRLVTYRDYRLHNGNIYAALEDMLHLLPVKEFGSFGVVAERGREFFTAGVEVNEQVALIAGVKHPCPDVRSIITIGGETFGLILLDQLGHYKKYISNSACAAGTGSFLDQQASRLGLSGSRELSLLAENYQESPPKIATRCAVFAKTDLVHIQQQGYGLPAIAAGLCHGVAQNIYDTLFHGVEVSEPIAVVGGVSRNTKVVHYLQEALKRPLQVPADSEYIGAIGAALSAAEKQRACDSPPIVSVEALLTRTTAARSYYYPPLSHLQGTAPDFSAVQSSIVNEVEIDLYEELEPHTVIECYLGIDVGSTSTKAALMDPKKTVLLGTLYYYRRQPHYSGSETDPNPAGA